MQPVLILQTIPWQTEDGCNKEATWLFMFKKALRSGSGFAWTCPTLRTWPSSQSHWPLWQWRMQRRGLFCRPQKVKQKNTTTKPANHQREEMASTSYLQRSSRSWYWCGCSAPTIWNHSRGEEERTCRRETSSGCLNVDAECCLSCSVLSRHVCVPRSA